MPREVALLPSGEFPRFSIAVAAAIAVGLLLDLTVVRDAPQQLFLSNALDLAMLALATACAFQSARLLTGYARHLWTLLGTALALESVGQSLTTYYQSFVPGYSQMPLPSDIFFFVWTAPVFLMFVSGSDENAREWDWLQILDFAQLTVVALTVYCYLFYVPSHWQANANEYPREILLVFVARDALLSAGFFFRARRAGSAGLRRFSLGMSAVFLMAAMVDGEYLGNLQASTTSATWGDFFWLFPYFLMVVMAVFPQLTKPESIVAPRSRAGNIAFTHIVPVCIPLLVIFMGRRIAKEQVVIAWLAVTASFFCAALRLVLTNDRQRRISGELLATEKALYSSEQMFASAFRASPDACSINFFPDGAYIDVNDGFGRLTGYAREETLGKTPREMNLWRDFSRRAEIIEEFAERGEVREAEFGYRTKNNAMRTGLLSGALLEIDGRPCVLMVVRDISDRKAAEELLRSSEERFRTLVRDLHVGVVLHGARGQVEFVNQAGLDIFGVTESQILQDDFLNQGFTALDEDGRELLPAERPVPKVFRTKEAVLQGTMGWRRHGSSDVSWVFGNAVPQMNWDGTIRRVISSFTDITAIKNAERSIHHLSTQLLRLQDEERRRIGRELHDGMAQTVLAINLNLAQVRQLTSPLSEPAQRAMDKARELLQQMSREIRTLSYLLHPPLLDDLGLVSALKEYVHGFSERSGIRTELLYPAPFPRLPQIIETTFFRIVQEGLGNIQRHSGSAGATVSLATDDREVSLEIRDAGKGMILPTNGTHHPGEARLGVGITGMRERMSQIGGQLELRSSPAGTTVRAAILHSAAVFRETRDDVTSHFDRG